MLEKDLLWAMLPDGLEEFFEIESFNKSKKFFDIVLVEKNIVPVLPKQYQGKKIVNNVLKPLTILSFPIKGKHCQITLKRRYWKVEGVEKMYSRQINLCHEGTKLDKEFAVFLKDCLESEPVSISLIARFNKINAETLEKQYKYYLSDFFEWLPEHNTDALVFPENLGKKVAIDETALTNGELYTIVTNKDKNKKGKIIALVKGTKASVVNSALAQIPLVERMKVAEVTVDLDNSMDWICRNSFCNSLITGDRFHVQKIITEAVQEIRIDLRRSAIKEENKGAIIRYENGDTKKQLLARSRYLLFKPQKQWTKSQAERAQILFREYPELEQAYGFYISFRDIFELSKDRSEAQTKLSGWIEAVRFTDLDQLTDATKTIERNLGKILNYFVNRETNASAESFNAQIKGFRALLRGVRDLDFFLFRVCKLYA